MCTVRMLVFRLLGVILRFSPLHGSFWGFSPRRGDVVPMGAKFGQFHHTKLCLLRLHQSVNRLLQIDCQSGLWKCCGRVQYKTLCCTGCSCFPLNLLLILPRVGPRYPFPAFFLPCLFTSSSFVFFTFFYSRSLYLFSSFVHPFTFYQNSHHFVSRPEIVGGDRTWV